MSSIVLELQHDAMEKQTEIDDLLRKCVVIASKLQLTEFLAWAKHELSGYGDSEVPEYRIVSCDIKAWNPYNGIWMPMIWTQEPPVALSKRAVGQPVSELQHLLRGGSGILTMALPEKTAYQIMQRADAPTAPVSVISRSSIHGILDAIRNAILDWSLKLEADGILGEGMTFTNREKQTAMSNTYNIQNLGVLGNVTAQKVHIGDYNSIRNDLKKLKIAKEEQDELKQLMEQTPKATGSEKKSLVAKGLDWVMRNSSNLGQLSDSIREWFQTA